MYLWHVLHRDTDELIRKIYETQKRKHNKGDWFEIMQNERSKYGIVESDTEISVMSQEKFRNMVEKKIQACAIKYLQGLASRHSKSANISVDKLEKKGYFSDRRFSKEDVQLLFALKTKMIECKSNFSNQYGDNLICRICQDVNSIEDEDHILVCPILNTEHYDVTFSDVYRDIDTQYNVTKVYKKVLRRRNVYLEAMN